LIATVTHPPLTGTDFEPETKSDTGFPLLSLYNPAIRVFALL
jgi:hypothetical protein